MPHENKESPLLYHRNDQVIVIFIWYLLLLLFFFFFFFSAYFVGSNILNFEYFIISFVIVSTALHPYHKGIGTILTVLFTVTDFWTRTVASQDATVVIH